MNFVTPITHVSDLNLTELNGFLAGIERRAYRIALSAVGNTEDALDIVQDSMLKLARLYADKTEQEWRILFYRILQSRIRDWYRRQKVRRAVMGWLPQQSFDNDDPSPDPMENVATQGTHSPEGLLINEQIMAQLDVAIKNLPGRQREAFFLRCWEGMSTAETARTMNVSEGSVKTHYSRALKSLRKAIGGQYEPD